MTRVNKGYLVAALTAFVFGSFFGMNYKKIGFTGRMPASAGPTDEQALANFDPTQFQIDAEVVALENVARATEDLEAMSDDQLKERLLASAAAVEKELKEHPEYDKETKRVLKKYVKQTRRLANSPDRRERSRKILKDIWTGIKRGSDLVIRTTAHAASIIDLTMTVVPRLLYKFARGVVTGDAVQAPGNRYWYRRTEGLDNGLTFIANYGLYHFIAGNPLVGAIFVSPIIDIIALERCEEPNRSNPREVRFCKNFFGVKDAVRKFTSLGDRGGASVHQFVEKTFAIRRGPNGKVDTKFCKKGMTHQANVANRVISRNFAELQEQGKLTANVVPYPATVHPSGRECIGIAVMTSDSTMVTQMDEKYGNAVEGLYVDFAQPEQPDAPEENDDENAE